MSKLSPSTWAFVARDAAPPKCMTAYQVFRLPPREKPSSQAAGRLPQRCGRKTVQPETQVAGQGVASWETVEPDLRYHVRHIAVPAPGSAAIAVRDRLLPQQPLLDRSRPCGSATSSRARR